MLRTLMLPLPCLLLALGGCSETTRAPLTARLNPSLYSVHQPVVQTTNYVLDLRPVGDLDAYERGRLNGWLETLGLQYGDRVFIDWSAASQDPGAAAAVARVVGEYGLLVEEGAPVTAGLQPGAMRVIVSRTTASVPGCPDWSNSGQIGTPISTDTNYGCATNSNLAAMIADPNDLVRGRTGGTSEDATEVAKSVTTYRNRQQSGHAGTVQAEGVGK